MARRPVGKPKHVKKRVRSPKGNACAKTARKDQIAKVLARLKLLPKNKTGSRRSSIRPRSRRRS